MDRKTIFKSDQSSDRVEPVLPALPEGLESALQRGHTLPIEGTNVVRVPFGVRHSRRVRAEPQPEQGLGSANLRRLF
jgi:hypothetical protein